jgi:hypothetical protein
VVSFVLLASQTSPTSALLSKTCGTPFSMAVTKTIRGAALHRPTTASGRQGWRGSPALIHEGSNWQKQQPHCALRRDPLDGFAVKVERRELNVRKRRRRLGL